MRQINGPRFLLWILAVIVTSGVLGACGNTSTGDATQAMGASDAARDDSRPLSTEERDLITEAEGILTQRCMARAGFRIFLTDGVEEPADLPYGNDDAEFARTHGLARGEVITTAARNTSDNGRYFAGLGDERRAAYLLALNGDTAHHVTVALPGGGSMSTSTRGCTAQAQTELYGDAADWFRVSVQVEAISATYLSGVTDDAAYRAALLAWTRCMARAGHPADSPADLRDRLAHRQDRAAELESALAEAGCSRGAGLTRTGEAIERRERARAFAGRQSLVETYQTMSSRALDRAGDLTNSAS